ncbi:hypothetical protein [Bacillus proteolyticus]|uniref:hypothetical protein n=1 Tax=Bacillus proteolyticus TaxID=2026192 RepID=UPI003D077DDC
MEELSAAAREKLGGIAKNQEKKPTTSKMYETIALRQANLLYSKMELMNKAVNEFAVSELPVKLYSLKNLLDGIEELNMKFRYKVMVYRYLKQQGIPKIKIQSLIRYRREDLESTAILLAFVLLLSMIAPSLANAKSVKPAITNEFIEKVSPYVELQNKKFKLKDDAYKYLDKKTIKSVRNYKCYK